MHVERSAQEIAEEMYATMFLIPFTNFLVHCMHFQS